MKAYLKDFLRGAQRAAGALQYAEAPEFLMQRDKDALIRQTLGSERSALTRSAPVVPPPAPARRVALVAERSLHPGALRYAVNVCERLSAQLELLAGPAVNGVERVLSGACRASRVPWRVIPLGPDCLEELGHYAKTSSGLLFVVTSAEDPVADRVVQSGGKRRYFKGEVPLVIVAGDLAVA